VVVDGLGWILTTDDNVVNVAASGANTLAFSVNQAGITHNNLAGLTTGDPTHAVPAAEWGGDGDRAVEL
jgi:hypothetical protein